MQLAAAGVQNIMAMKWSSPLISPQKSADFWGRGGAAE